MSNYLALRRSAAPALTVTALTISTLTGSTMVTSSIIASGLSLSTITVSTINGSPPGSGSVSTLTSTMVSIGASTNQTYNNFSNGSYLTWATPKSDMTSANKTVQSANGLYQMIVANATSGLFLSSDSGITWSTLSGGLPTLTGSAYWSDGAISANGQYITLSIYGGSLWMSADYGRTFALTNQPTPDIWLPLNGNTTDLMGLSVVTTPGTVPGYVTLNYPGYTAQAVNLLNTAGGTAMRYIRGTWTGSPNFTVSFWMNPQTVNGSQQTVFSTYTGGIQVYIQPSTNYLFYQIPSGGASGVINGQVVTTYALSVNTWYYITIIFQTNGLCSLYVNNTLIGSATNVGGYGTYVPTPFSLGTYDTATTNAFNGYINDLRITNSVSTYVPIPLLQPNIWMPFENTAGDLGSNAITPTVTGSLSYVPGVVGLNAVHIANTAGGTANNFIRGAWSLPSNFTISFWVNQQSSSTSQPQMIFSSAGGTVAILFNTSNQMYANFLTGGGTAYTAITTSFTFSTNTWYHIYYLFQTGGMCALYVNGVMAGSFTNTSGIGTQTTSAFGLGTYEVTSNNIALNGYIDDFRIYHAAIPIHVLFPQNYRSLALSGTGQYALAAAASGWVVGSSDVSKTWSKQAVSIGTQSNIIQPNLTALGSSGTALTTSWTINGVTWTASTSSIFDTTTAVSNVFNNSSSLEWVPLSATYTTAGNTSGKITTIEGGIGNVTGEWLQIQSSVPLIMLSYQFATGNVVARTPKTYYIVGSTNGNTWFPVQYGAAGAVTTTAAYTTVPNTIIVNNASTQIFGSSTITTTTYATTTNTYSYFRLICLSSYSGTNDVVSLGEWFINFVSPLTSSRPSIPMISINHTGQYQLVATGPASGTVMPNQTGLVAYNWSNGGVNWTASSSSVYLNLFAYGAFNTVNSAVGSYSWASNMGTYSATSPFACATGISTTIQGIGPTVGEWLQLQSSVPLVMQSYTYGCGGSPNIPKNYYIIGSNDGSTWFPIQLAIMTTNPFTANFQLATTYIIVNQSGTQTITGAQTGSGSFTTYATTTNAYTYFRIVITNLYGNSTLTELGEWYINFRNSVSYSTNYGSTWLNTSQTVSNESAVLSASGQYALSTNSVAPFARLMMEGNNLDSQGNLTPTTGAGTSYPATYFKVGSNAAYFNNTAGGSPANYLNYTVPTVLNRPPTITMACWVYPTSIISNVTPMAICVGSSWGNHFYINSTVNFYWATTTTNGGTGLTSTATAPLNVWTHLAMTYTGTVISLYVNGIIVASVNTTGTLCATLGGNLTNVLIGCGIIGANAFAGYVDDVRIYTSALNADEVNGLFKNPTLTQTVAVSNSYLPITSYTEPILPGITAPIVDTAVSQTGQYMVAVTSSTTNNVYYSTDYGATFTALTVGTSAMVSCSISYDGSYLTVENATTVYTLNRNTRGFSVTVGNQAGLINQGLNAIAIGNQAGRTNQSANSIVLNASGSALDAVAPGFYVAPLATTTSSSATSFSLLGYGTDNQVTQTNLTVLSNGFVGIGTTNPAALLEFGKGGGYDGSSNTNQIGFSWNGSGGGYRHWIISRHNSATSNTGNGIDFYLNNSTTANGSVEPKIGSILGMSVTAAGVGIGTTAPAYPLHVVGNVNLTGSILYNGVAITTGAGSIWTAGAGGVAYYNGGNVGIGTATPNSFLTVYTTASRAAYHQSSSSSNTGCYSEWRDFNATGRFIVGCDGPGLANFEVGAGIISTYSPTPLIFMTNSIERMRILSSGNVGINTGAPLSRFTIRCGYSDGETGGLCIDSNDGNVYNLRLSSFVQGNGQVGYRFGVNNLAAAYPNTVVLGYNGNVGIGTSSPAVVLDIRGTAYSSSTITNVSNFNSAISLILSSPSSGANSSAFMGCREFGGGGGVGFAMWRGGSYDTYLQAYTCTSGAGAMGAVTGGPYVGNGGASWTSASDMRLKEDWINIDNVLDKLLVLTTGTFQWKDRPDRSRSYGLIAQEVQIHFPEMISTDSQGYLGIQYTEMVPVAVKAIQVLTNQVYDLKSQVASLSASHASLLAWAQSQGFSG